MDDPYDPVVTEDKVPGYEVLAQKVRELDNTIFIYRIYYLLNTFTYRFQLIKKDRMCIVEVPRSLLENLHNDGAAAENELARLVSLSVENSDCWQPFES